jgi:hypothetical protein
MTTWFADPVGAVDALAAVDGVTEVDAVAARNGVDAVDPLEPHEEIKTVSDAHPARRWSFTFTNTSVFPGMLKAKQELLLRSVQGLAYHQVTVGFADPDCHRL